MRGGPASVEATQYVERGRGSVGEKTNAILYFSQTAMLIVSFARALQYVVNQVSIPQIMMLPRQQLIIELWRQPVTKGEAEHRSH